MYVHDFFFVFAESYMIFFLASRIFISSINTYYQCKAFMYNRNSVFSAAKETELNSLCCNAPALKKKGKKKIRFFMEPHVTVTNPFNSSPLPFSQNISLSPSWPAISLLSSFLLFLFLSNTLLTSHTLPSVPLHTTISTCTFLDSLKYKLFNLVIQPSDYLDKLFRSRLTQSNYIM